MNRLTVYVSGKVQKVVYRKRVIDIARAFGIKGIVENLDDGRVKIIAEGDDETDSRLDKGIDVMNKMLVQLGLSQTAHPAASCGVFIKNKMNNFIL